MEKWYLQFKVNFYEKGEKLVTLKVKVFLNGADNKAKAEEQAQKVVDAIKTDTKKYVQQSLGLNQLAEGDEVKITSYHLFFEKEL